MHTAFLEHRVPVTAKLSRKFYERLGDDIATELVDWFNAVDLTYQTQLREMNDLNWERFKSHLDSSLAALRAELQGEFRSGLADLRTEIGKIENKLLNRMLIYSTGLFVGLGGLMISLAMYLRG
jgi:hypothetical protein